MFELPDAKRVRREDLDGSSDDEKAVHDEQQDAELLAKLHARMAGMLDLSGIDPRPTKTTSTTGQDAPMTDGPNADDANDDDGPEEFEFRLFTTTDLATKIALVDEDELALQRDGDMLRKRPLSYYIAGEPTSEAKAELAFAAVSGDEVLARATQRWWGMEMPWRVTRIPGASKKRTKTTGKGGAAEDEEDKEARRRRPGKKKRIALRVRERERKKKAEEEEMNKAGKEEALKEKKKRLNRLKKLRKRAKAKEGKKGDGGEDGAEGGDSGSGSDGGDE
ncbi:hypothetical protein CH063_04354 [Colletotrichum higginsianum]|uniref:Uncharacterized protein n=2 Tax=Colletotrichum higginsianum TaxID=80884 RepID=H1UV20_COLHI|nr:hypothetical protein CH63R_04342 [Colletotrichum higginsianum IMI 349063]OBR12046.1 hypothetical protein CH63R_04342 [Colletotrichum higginsianum IMI 349063]TIC99130.1 hypothetical protein CH35J_005808 [Colletotrichum higginsianum]GJC93719.1 hypothetical protein ColKHC_02545 [Colletotrichum higginsianum]CCF31821.1 hypothetical protein CH063_04354 [Colletotrichum higginsianum]